ncbi:DUF3618 domain-containing protein [Kitasatospora sp. NPDC001540]|uniref:DUF3618 domain-containing protein n=1 Tax=Kitasatospora sp. NPDC001540 TaxID=3364014 RepID=UPI0036A6B59C
MSEGTPTGQPLQGDESAQTDRLREQVERTREELGRTVEALAAKADVKEQVKEKAAEWKEQAAGTAAHLTDQLREKAGRAAELVKDRTPDPVLDKAGQAAAQVRDTAAQAGHLAAEKTPDQVREKAATVAAAARANRTPLLAGAAVLVVTLFLLRGRKHK